MSDKSLPQIIRYGTQAARVAFVPDPAPGSQVLYLWYETDHAPNLYAWDGSAWVQLNAGGSAEYNAGTSGASLTIDWANGIQQIVTLTASCTFTLTHPVAGRTYRLILLEDGTGGWTPTFPGTVQWENGTPPAWVTTASNVIVVSFLYTALGGDGYFGFATLAPLTSP